MSAKKSEKKKPRSHRHQFLFKVPSLRRTGATQVLRSWAKVIDAKKPVSLMLKAEYVQRSIEEKGRGSTQTCAMAICAQQQADAFPHPVEGYIDWQYSRAYVVTKVNADGMPSECVCYWHWDDVARVHDSDGGQKKLLAKLIKTGDREIHLLPPRNKSRRVNRPKADIISKTKVKRGPEKTLRLRGANLRYANAILGIAA